MWCVHAKYIFLGIDLLFKCLFRPISGVADCLIFGQRHVCCCVKCLFWPFSGVADCLIFKQRHVCCYVFVSNALERASVVSWDCFY